MRRFIRPFAAVVGPAAVMTAGIMGAGSTTSLVLAGTYFGYSLLWVAVITLPVVVIAEESASRIGIMAGNQGMFSIIRDRTHPIVPWLLLITILPLAMLGNMSQTKVMVHSLLTIGGIENPGFGTTAFATVAIVGLTIASVLFGGYKRIERIMTSLLFVIAIAFLLVAAKGFTEIGDIAKGLVPNIPEDTGGRSAVHYIAAIAGGAVAATAILSFPYFTAEAGYTPKDIPRGFKKAVITLGVIFGIYSVTVLVAGGSVLNKLPNAAEIQTAGDAGRVLGPVLGRWSVVAFSLGLAACAYTTFVLVAQLVTYFILDTLKLDWRFDLSNRRFLWIFAASMVVPGILSAFWDFPALLAIVLSMALGVVITPFAILLVIFLINRRELMDGYKASWIRNAILLFGLLLSLWIAIRKVIPYLMGE
jgi:Mn2+/Fe2+ NRAMP family transporter